MTNDAFVEILAALISGQPKRVRTGTQQLVEVCQDVSILTDGVDLHPDLALADAEQFNREQRL